jgi:hypothetical protein
VTRRLALLVCLPTLLAAVLVIPLWAWRGDYQLLCAVVAVVLVVPGAVGTFVVSERLAKIPPFGPLLAVVIGTYGRIVLGFGGAAVVFFASKPTFYSDPLSFWGWVLGTYLATLVVETVLLARNRAHGTEPPKA